LDIPDYGPPGLVAEQGHKGGESWAHPKYILNTLTGSDLRGLNPPCEVGILVVHDMKQLPGQ